MPGAGAASSPDVPAGRPVPARCAPVVEAGESRGKREAAGARRGERRPASEGPRRATAARGVRTLRGMGGSLETSRVPGRGRRGRPREAEAAEPKPPETGAGRVGRIADREPCDWQRPAAGRGASAPPPVEALRGSGAPRASIAAKPRGAPLRARRARSARGTGPWWRTCCRLTRGTRRWGPTTPTPIRRGGRGRLVGLPTSTDRPRPRPARRRATPPCVGTAWVPGALAGSGDGVRTEKGA